MRQCETPVLFSTPRNGPDGKLVAVCNGAQTIRLWDLETKKVSRELVGDQNYSRAIISSDGKWLAASEYRSLKVAFWDLTSGERLEDVVIPWAPKTADQLATLAKRYEELIREMSFIEGSKRLLVQMHAGAGKPNLQWHDVVLWDLRRKGIHRASAATPAHAMVRSLTPDGRQPPRAHPAWTN